MWSQPACLSRIVITTFAKLAFAGTALALPHYAQAAEPAATDVPALERRAIAVADKFITTLYSKDAERALTYLTQNAPVTTNPARVGERGPGALSKVVEFAKSGNVEVTLDHTYALGGPSGIIVVQRRLDTAKIGGKTSSGKIGAIYLIDPVSWKIKYFSDVMITPPAAGMPPLPADDASF